MWKKSQKHKWKFSVQNVRIKNLLRMSLRKCEIKCGSEKSVNKIMWV